MTFTKSTESNSSEIEKNVQKNPKHKLNIRHTKFQQFKYIGRALKEDED